MIDDDGLLIFNRFPAAAKHTRRQVRLSTSRLVKSTTSTSLEISSETRFDSRLNVVVFSFLMIVSSRLVSPGFGIFDVSLEV